VATETAIVRVKDGIQANLREAEAGLDHGLDALRDRSRTTVVTWSARAKSVLRDIAAKCGATVASASRDVEMAGERILADAELVVTTAESELGKLPT
jgi:hypothetical protein